MEERIMMNSNEKLAREVVGLEGNAKHFVLNGEAADKTLQREAASKFNNQVEDYISKFDSHEKALSDYAENLKENLNDLEIKAIYNYVLIKPYAENPFQKITVSKSGIITDLGGQNPIYKSNETGEYEEEEQFIHIGEVIDAGPDCKYVKDGDVVYWPKVSEAPVPFFKQGLVLVNEQRILVVINKGLTERFKFK